MKARILMVTLLLAAMAAPAFAETGRQLDVSRIRNARFAFEDIMNAPDRSIPEQLLGSASCIAIIPGVKRAAFIFGGRYGRGLVTCRAGNGLRTQRPACRQVIVQSRRLKVSVLL